MFYFTCNASKIYESFTFWNKLQEKMNFFHDIQIYWDAAVLVKHTALQEYSNTHGSSFTLGRFSVCFPGGEIFHLEEEVCFPCWHFSRLC